MLIRLYILDLQPTSTYKSKIANTHNIINYLINLLHLPHLLDGELDLWPQLELPIYPIDSSFSFCTALKSFLTFLLNFLASTKELVK